MEVKHHYRRNIRQIERHIDKQLGVLQKFKIDVERATTSLDEGKQYVEERLNEAGAHDLIENSSQWVELLQGWEETRSELPFEADGTYLDFEGKF